MKKIDCPTAEQWIVRTLDEELLPEKSTRLEEHIHECAACSRMREATKEVMNLVSRDVPADPGDEFWRLYDQSLEAKLREKEMKASRWFGWKSIAAAVLSGIVIMAVLIEKYDGKMNDMPPSNQVAFQVANELAELYDPIQEESPSYGLYAGPLLTPLTSQTSYNNGMASWLEVEDDPDQLFM